MPSSWLRPGARRRKNAEIGAENSGSAPLSIPATDDDTHCSATGNSVIGIASHTIASSDDARQVGPVDPGAARRRDRGQRGEPEGDPQPRDDPGLHRLESLGDEQERGAPDDRRERDEPPVDRRERRGCSCLRPSPAVFPARTSRPIANASSSASGDVTRRSPRPMPRRPRPRRAWHDAADRAVEVAVVPRRSHPLKLERRTRTNRRWNRTS